MANEKEKVSFLGSDEIETPDEIISTDKDNERKAAFKEAYKKVMQIVPRIFYGKEA